MRNDDEGAAILREENRELRSEAEKREQDIARIAELHDQEIRTLRSELRAANERVADLAGQIDWKSKAKILTEAEAAGIADLRAQFEALNDSQNQIAKFLRDNYSAEITNGSHNGRSLSNIVCGYLGELQERRKRLPWWKRLVA